MATRTAPDRAWFAASLVGVALLLLTLQPYSFCPFAVVTGLPCPGCGLTRSLVALASGDLRRAWHHHPLGPLLAGVVAGLTVLRLRWPSKISRFDWGAAPNFVWWWGLGLVAAVWVARFCGAFNGPAEVHSPFELLQTLNRK